ncbi:MAG: nucleoside triphosphate pyrophosphohydrolase [Robiginitomaculum sp.]|nr:nucleoside triphosphate pyrophosphohydrolase [Robiginitomaculum sp.]
MNIRKIANSLGDTPCQRLLTMMARLRDPETGCPWDVEQTFKTIAPYTIEEAYEVNDAIERGHMGDLKEELGDLLLQVVFHARMAEEQGEFDFNAISDALVEKMIARHPHVFGGADERDSETQTKAWESMKAEERAEKSGAVASALDGVASALPALMRAEKLQKRAARVGFDWAEAKQVLDKIIEEAEEITEAQAGGESQHRIHEEVGDLIFAVTNLARKLGVDPEHALRDTNKKFTTRFHHMEQNTDAGLETLSLEQLEELWVAAKRSGG